jgi:hypothetical protein
MSEKLCLFCKHYSYEQIDGQRYSSWTIDMVGGCTCNKGHFASEMPSDEKEYRELLLRAGKCKDYERPKE